MYLWVPPPEGTYSSTTVSSDTPHAPLVVLALAAGVAVGMAVPRANTGPEGITDYQKADQGAER